MPAEEEKPVLVLMGDKGIGKSHLANELFGLDLPSSKAPRHVTQDQEMRMTPEDEHFSGVVDTKELDRERKNFLSMNDLCGKRLVLLFLNSDFRVEDSLTDIASNLGVKRTDIWVFNAFYFKLVLNKVERSFEWTAFQYESIIDYRSVLSLKAVTIPAPECATREPEVNNEQPKDDELTEVPSKSAAKKAAKKKRPEQFPRLHPTFGNIVNLNTTFSLDAVKLRFKGLSRENMLANCVEGDALLKLVMARLVTAGAFAKSDSENFQTNETLKAFVYKFLGEEETEKAAQRVGQSEMPYGVLYGNMFEAAIHLTFSANLLEELLKFCCGEV